MAQKFEQRVQGKIRAARYVRYPVGRGLELEYLTCLFLKQQQASRDSARTMAWSMECKGGWADFTTVGCVQRGIKQGNGVGISFDGC